MSGLRIFRRLLGHVWPYRLVFALSIVGMILVAAAETAFAALLKPIMDGGFIERDAAMIKWAPGVLVIIFLVRSFGS
ncbi:MAG TPA: hypothetical protein QF617_10810, partial [Arenicellales bacterium]|nr:hypothetical protein [Arenicellales bacterium]